MNFKALALAAIAAAAFAAPAFAHHSFAMFDAQKTLSLEGAVTDFEWTNPHSWIRLNVADDSGTARPWAIEMGSPATNAQRGWKSDTLRAGDKIKLTIHPLKDGSRGGQFVTVILPNGQRLFNPRQVAE